MASSKSLTLLKQYLDSKTEIPMDIRQKIMEYAFNIGLESLILAKRKN